MPVRKLTYGVQSFLLSFLVLGILCVLNFLALDNFFRLDLTQYKEYTISPASRKLVSNLDDIVHIKVYFSRNLPPYLLNLERQVKDILDEYRAYGRGNLRLEFIDPSVDSKTEQRVRQLGIPKVQLNIIAKDQAQVRPAYLGLALFYEDKRR